MSRTLAVLPTGTGKTVIFAQLCKRWHDQGLGRVLVMAHREELISQACQKIADITGELPDVEMGDSRADECAIINRAPVVVTSVQTMCRPKRHERFHPEDFSLMIVDEAHHSTAATYRRVIDYFGQNPNLKILGVTATPDRADEEALGQIFETVAYEYQIQQAIEDGWLVNIDQRFILVDGLDLSACRTTAGDLNEGDLAKIMEMEKVLHGVVGPTIELAGDTPTLIFNTSVAQAERTAEIINRHRPDSAVCLHGKTPREERREKLKAFSRREYQYLCNCGLFLEGFDETSIGVVAMARPTKSRSLYAQAVGRGTRPLPGIVDGLDDAGQRRNAIALSAKPSCIAIGTPILTDRGLVPIERVTVDMKVWDGIAFVTHCGILFRGKQRVVSYAGLTATPDHEVWTYDKASRSPSQKNWQTFWDSCREQAAICVTGIGGQAVREIDGHYRGGGAYRAEIAPVASGRMPMRASLTEELHVAAERHGGLPQVRRQDRDSSLAVAPRHVSQRAMHESQMPHVSTIRWERDQILFPNDSCNGQVGHGESRRAARYGDRSDRQRRGLRCWQSSLHDALAEHIKHIEAANQCGGSCVFDSPSGSPIFRRPSQAALTQWDDLEADCRPPCWTRGRAGASWTVQGEVEVFDIINAGPRHRFTAAGLLVSNCLVLDFVGNSGRHKLCSTADILGGNFSDEETELAEATAKKKSARGEKADMLEELKSARDAIEEAARRKRAAVTARANFRAQSVNPFDVFDMAPKREAGWHKGRKPTDKMIATLVKFKVPDAEINKLSFSQAGQLLDKLIGRMKESKCTYKQAALLRKHGYSVDVTMQEANGIIDALAKNGWRRPAEVSA